MIVYVIAGALLWLALLAFSLALAVAAREADRAQSRRHLRLVSRDEQAEKSTSE